LACLLTIAFLLVEPTLALGDCWCAFLVVLLLVLLVLPVLLVALLAPVVMRHAH